MREESLLIRWKPIVWVLLGVLVGCGRGGALPTKLPARVPYFSDHTAVAVLRRPEGDIYLYNFDTLQQFQPIMEQLRNAGYDCHVYSTGDAVCFDKSPTPPLKRIVVMYQVDTFVKGLNASASREETVKAPGRAFVGLAFEK